MFCAIRCLVFAPQVRRGSAPYADSAVLRTNNIFLMVSGTKDGIPEQSKAQQCYGLES